MDVLDGGSQSVAVRDQIVALLPRLRRFCLALTGSTEDCDDLVQTTVERALGRIAQWQSGTRLDSWMFRIAQNANIDAARSRSRRGTDVGEEGLVHVAGDDGRIVTETRWRLERARAAIAALPDDQRALITLIVVDGRSYKEAASILEVPIGTVMSRLARARKTIDIRLNGTPPQDVGTP